MIESPTVNLVKGRKPHFIDQFISWALTVGRALVIVTETIALSAFLYRFGLDREIIDLHDKITQEQNIVRFLKKDEEKFRNLQNRLELASAIIKSENQSTKLYQDIISFVPSDMIVQTLTISADNITIEATTQSVSSIVSFTKSLKEYPTIKSVSLDTIENNTSNGIITIGVTALMKKLDNKPI